MVDNASCGIPRTARHRALLHNTRLFVKKDSRPLFFSIRFFSEIIGQHHTANVSWAPGQELELAPKNKVEADFILWYQRKMILGNDYLTEIVFGEAKSFGREAFQLDDINRMKALATRFPGAILVFSTMKQAGELSSNEISRITKLAKWGREYIRGKQKTRAPVIILTGVELFTAYSLHTSWESVGGRHTQFMGDAHRVDNLRVLADFTQQLYLNMPSYSEWFSAKRRRASR